MSMGLRHYDIAGTALNAYKTIDDSMRANRREEALNEERVFQRERQTKSDARAEEEFGWKKQTEENKRADEELELWWTARQSGQDAAPSELAAKRMRQLGVGLPGGPANVEEAVRKGKAAAQLKHVLPTFQQKLQNVPTGTMVDISGTGVDELLQTINPERYGKVFTDKQGEYRTTAPKQAYVVRQDGEIAVALQTGVQRKDANGSWVDTGEAVPLTKNQTRDDRDPISIRKLSELTQQLGQIEQFNKAYLDMEWAVTQHLANKGSKSALEKVSAKKSRQEISALAEAYPEHQAVLSKLGQQGVSLETAKAIVQKLNEDGTNKNLTDVMPGALSAANKAKGNIASKTTAALDYIKGKGIQGKAAQAIMKDVVAIIGKDEDNSVQRTKALAASSGESGKLDDKAIDDVFKRIKEAGALQHGGKVEYYDSQMNAYREKTVKPDPVASQQAYRDSANVILAYAGSGKISPNTFKSLVGSLPPEQQDYIRQQMGGAPPPQQSVRRTGPARSEVNTPYADKFTEMNMAGALNR